MLGVRFVRHAVIVAVTCAGFLAPLGAAGAAQAVPSLSASSATVGKPWHPAKRPSQDGQLGQFSSQSPQRAAEQAAVAQARATGKPVVVGSLTTGTLLETAKPDGTLVASTNILPVRVKTNAGWVPVDTRLRLSGGRLAAVAVPGDTVSFSAGGTSVAARISDGKSSLGLFWPGTLPAPAVSGSSATYPNVLPGVNLVLTAVSGHSGGFQEVLVVTSRQAAGDKGLASLAWRVSAPGTSGLRALPGGALLAPGSTGPGFVAAAAMMWDSSTLALTAPRSAVRTAMAAARTAGAGLATNGMGAVSSVSTPAAGAREAAVRTRVAGSVLSLVPDAALLSSAATRFPVFIDPSFQPWDDTSGTQAYDTVQSDTGNNGCSTYFGGCDTGTSCTGPHYSTSITTTGDSPVGFDNFGAGGNCQSDDTDYTLYRVGIPSGATATSARVFQASFQIKEGYSSDCASTATMTATWIGGFSSSTGWPGPGKTADDQDAHATLGPDTYTSNGTTYSSCNNVDVVNNGVTVAAGFTVTTDLQKIGPASDITFRVWEDPAQNPSLRDSHYPSQPSTVLHKQLTVNPTLEVHWIYLPTTPLTSTMVESPNSDRSGPYTQTCGAKANPPKFGATNSVNGIYLATPLSTPGDPNGGTANQKPGVSYNVRYATGTSTTPTWTLDTNHPSGTSGATFSVKLTTSGYADGTIIQWEAQADIGQANGAGTDYTSSWSNPCFFAVYPHGPNPPTVKATFTQSADQAVGTTVKFTITQSSGDTVSKFVWGLDNPPPASSPAAGQTCTTTAAESSILGSCTQISGGSATLSITVESPGPHNVYVYEMDTGNNDSGWTYDPACTGCSTFTGKGDPVDSYASTAAGSTLQANFTVALGAGKSYDNTMISKAAGTQGGASADSNSGGNSFDEAELQSAGWKPGGTVTIDGATLTLPKFGTSSSGPDNVLAANQVIGTGQNGAQGTSLVFLATSTNATVAIPGNSGTGADDSGVLAADVTAPMTPAGWGVTGSGCAVMGDFVNSATCVPASGTINYSGTCTANGSTITQTPYTLTVPDWVTGPADIAAVQLPDRDHTGGQQALNPMIYAFSVPLPGGCTVASVQLPDVGPNASGPALHILGMTVRNTTTATPQVGGAMPASPSGQGWTGAYASAIDNAYNPPSGKTWGNQTVRIAVSPGVSAAAGADVRIRLSDPGYWSEDGSGPLTIGAASIAPQAGPGSPAATAAPTPLTFNGSSSVVVPEGGDIYSDPIPLPFAVSTTTGILVSLYLQNAALPVLPLNNNTSGSQSWFAASTTPNETGVQAATPFTSGGGYGTNTVPILTGLDVTTPAEALQDPVTGANVNYPGQPTVVVTGDGTIVDGESNPLPPDVHNYPSQRLAGQLVYQADAPGFGVVDTSVENNMVMFDAIYPDSGIAPNGLNLAARIDHDVLAEPDLGTVIVHAGLQDMLWEDGTYSGTDSIVKNTLKAVARQLGGLVTGGGFGGLIVGTLTPCNGYANANDLNTCDQYVEAARIGINDAISGWSGLACDGDFSAGVTQPGTGTDPAANPGTLITTDDAGDHANLTLGWSGGYAAIATRASICGFYPPANPLPATP
jgi:hypothetical protein